MDKAVADKIKAIELLRTNGLLRPSLHIAEAAAVEHPDCAMVFMQMGLTQWNLIDVPGAVTSFNRALEIAPNNLPTLCNAAGLLTQTQSFDAAEAFLEECLKQNPMHGPSMYNRALNYLTQGDLEHGWSWFKNRVMWDGYFAGFYRDYDFKVPDWNGETDATVAVFNEQDMGERIMFANALPDLIATGAKVIVGVCDRQRKLFERSFPDATIATMDPVSGVTHRLLMGDMAAHFRPTMDSFPARRSYLVADPEKVDLYRRWVPKHRPVVGISWYSKNPAYGLAKSVPFEKMLSLINTQDVTFVNLQYGEEAPGGVMNIGTDKFLGDLDNQAALICACDLVITISNTTAHLAGALGVPTWIMLPAEVARLWYWFTDREDSPWYPSARLYRQEVDGDWGHVVDRIATDLKKFVSSGVQDDGEHGNRAAG